MVDVNEMLKKSQWWRADDLQQGDRLQIMDEGQIDAETFKPRTYLVLKAKLLRTGEIRSLRLGPRNVARLAETLGKDTKNWVGKTVEVVGIEPYAGLKAKGVLLRGCVEAKAPASLAQVSPETADVIRKSQYIIETGIPLNESDFSTLPVGIRAELLKHGFVTKQARNGETYYFFDKEKCKPFLA